MLSFLPLDDSGDGPILRALGCLGPILLTSSTVPKSIDPSRSYIVLVDTEETTVDEVTSWLDQGADKVIIPLSSAKACVDVIPKARILLLLDVNTVSTVPDKILSGISGIVLRTSSPCPDPELLSPIQRFFTNHDVFVLPTSTDSTPALSQASIRELARASIIPIIPTSKLTLEVSDNSRINVSDAFLAPLDTDRQDQLYPTVVSASNHGGKSLGLVYSSRESIAESIRTGKGVYQSRKHGLWRKGETSGATQDIVSIRVDCDHDSLEFNVVQHGTGFCHFGSASCFGGGFTGLAALETTLVSRRETAVEGSYTRRLFDDSDLLAAKIREEAEELIEAKSKEEIAFEAADLIYFAMTRCVAQGVSLADVEAVLDRKAKKVSRRPGNAKPKYVAKPKQVPTPVPNSQPLVKAPTTDVAGPIDPEQPIQMRLTDLDGIDSGQRSQLLRRPVLRSDEMIAKVKPIVDDVRQRGDKALVELTARFDKAQLSTPAVFAPFSPESMDIPEDVRFAIDVAYKNIYTFHAAQADKAPMVVETMPGVTCTRFARPIARVGLYVPGGTAILPSTALMLGIPAQVAGCKQIIIATPPRPDGSVSPEVVYVAKLVGASAILKTGGAQAIAALAYGTETVPKVDKIFGPGNQWVTAAKMLVQNDTDALVSIDMPAGPSEVLVMTDTTGNPAYIAADLLSQAEHGVDSQVVLVAVGITDDHLDLITKELDAQARALPRVDIVRESISKSIIVRTGTLDEGIAFSNDYAPEHLILHLQNAASVVAKIENAGSVFVGSFTPESCGDYASGTNHTLPTNGYARQFSGVNTLSFQKHITSQEISQAGLEMLGPVVVTLAECEGLSAHANAVRVRLQK